MVGQVESNVLKSNSFYLKVINNKLKVIGFSPYRVMKC